MWQKIKMIFTKIKPDIIRLIKAILKMSVDVLLPIALNAVVAAEKNGGTGKEKFDFAVDQVKRQAPKAAIGAAMSAVQNAWVIKEGEGWD